MFYDLNMNNNLKSKKMLINYLRKANFEEGSTIPPIRSLQNILLLSRSSVMSALHQLCEEGVLEKGQGARNGYIFRKLPETLMPTPRKDFLAQFVLPHNSWNYVGIQLLSNIEREFASNNGKIIFSNNENSIKTEHSILENILSSTSIKPDVLLLMASRSTCNPNLSLMKLIASNIPVVMVDRTVDGLDAMYVGLNNKAIGRDAVEKLWNKGHRTFAFIGGFSIISPIQDRLAGFLAGLSSKCCPKENIHTILSETMDLGGYHTINDNVSKVGEKILNLHPLPTGIVCGSDRIAVCLVNFFLNKGFSIPEDIAIIGCDGDSNFSKLCKKSLCSYNHPFKNMADSIYRIAYEVCNNPLVVPYQLEYPPNYKCGETI